MIKKVSVVVALCLFLMPSIAGAIDYKVWIPLLPRTLGGMAPSGKPDGMDMNMGGQQWSTLNQEYTSRDGKKTAQLTVVAGMMAPLVQGFQSMTAMNMNMDTNEQLLKIVTVSGKKGMITWDKLEKTGTLTIAVKQDMMVALTLEPTIKASELTTLAKQVPLSKFASSK